MKVASICPEVRGCSFFLGSVREHVNTYFENNFVEMRIENDYFSINKMYKSLDKHFISIKNEMERLYFLFSGKAIHKLVCFQVREERDSSNIK